MYDFLNVTVEQCELVLACIDDGDGHVSLSALADLEILYAAWRLADRGLITLTTRGDHWGFSDAP